MKAIHKGRLSKNRTVLIFIVSGLVAGIIIGWIYSATLTGQGYTKAASSTQEYLKQYSGETTNRMNIFNDSVLKHGKTVIMIWLLAFVPIGGFVIFMLIMIKGIGLGFTTAILYRMFKLNGLVCASLLYLPQCLILIPVYVFMSYSGINFILKHLNNKTKDSLAGYLPVLLPGIACTAAVGFLDAYAVPILIGNMIKP